MLTTTTARQDSSINRAGEGQIEDHTTGRRRGGGIPDAGETPVFRSCPAVDAILDG
jgi:hypothetical protein